MSFDQLEYQREYMKWYSQTDRGKATRKRYRTSERGRATNARQLRAYRKRYPEKVRAHAAVERAVKRGDLVRPDTCERCGDQAKFIEASHDDYEKKLEVEWLCKPCHYEKDRRT